jgi:hypothetical protein
MLRIAAAEVLRVIGAEEHVQTLEVKLLSDGQRGKALCYWKGTGLCKEGEHVLLNTTAVQLGLGTGGFHFVIGKWKDESEADLYPTAWGHIMKMRYTPLQVAVDSVEEQNSPYHEMFVEETRSLEGTPVVIGELHSLLPLLALTIKQRLPDRKLVYVMPDSASLPIAFSRHVQVLRSRDWISATVTAGQAWGGDLEAVNLYTGLLAAKWVAKGDLLLCLLGPGVAGTGTPFGFSGMQLADVVHAVSLLGGVPIVVPRISFSDPRPRHCGMSHHTRTVLRRFTLRPVILPVPRYGDRRDELLDLQEQADQLSIQHHRILLNAPVLAELEILQEEYPLSFTTMGRALRDDPSPFQAAYLAACVAVKAEKWISDRSAWTPEGDDPAILAALCSYLTNDEG